jgi:hypothetical protein
MAAKRVLVGLAWMAVLTMVVVLVKSGTTTPAPETRPALLTDPYVNTVYPSEWKTTLDVAGTQATFTPRLPDTTLANAGNMVAAYMWPQGEAVAFDFPAPITSSRSPVRQEYVEVYEDIWTGGDPLAAFKSNIAADPINGADIYYLGDSGSVPALGVTARSASDTEEANPAFLRFVVDGINVEISGGESLQDLIDIANSMLK